MRAIATIVLMLFTTGTALAQTPALFASWRPTTAVLATMQASACADARAAGRKDSSARHGSMGWMIGGLAAGVGLGFIGTGALTGVSAMGKPQPDDIPPGMDDACYREGYSGRARGQNVKAALFGGLIGAAAWVGIYLASHSD